MLICRETLHALLKCDLGSSDQLCDPARGASVETVEVWRQMKDINRKANSGTVPEWQRVAAINTFTELQTRLRYYNAGFEQLVASNPDFKAGLEAAKHIIHGILPPVERVWNDIWEGCKFGPGSFHGAVKHKIPNFEYSLYKKLGGPQTVNPHTRQLALQVLSEFYPSWVEQLVSKGVKCKAIRGNRLSHVSKDIGKCRPIALEPSLNVFLQAGVGNYMAQRLVRLGFADIYGGQEVQRREAQFLHNATIDLSSASDTIAIALVKYLLPGDWWELLEATRSWDWNYRGVQGRYENVSSQGNGFTFPLETLLFKAIVCGFTGVSQHSCWVYGDDIIVPVAYAEGAVKALEACGFIVNKEKSFWGQHLDWRADFRESCGADYYQEKLITPVFYRDDAKSLADVAALHNRLTERWSDPSSGYSIPLTLGYLRGVAGEKIICGPRFFISDSRDLQRWLGDDAILRSTQFPTNYVVTTYSNWFWDEPEFDSHRAYVKKERTLKDDEYDKDPFVYLMALLGVHDVTVPRCARDRIRTVHVTRTELKSLAPPKRWRAAHGARFDQPSSHLSA